jgi:hypothetical protein
MAIPPDCVWEVNTTGSDTAAGGGFSIAQKGATGTDMTYPTPAVTTFTSNLSATGTTTLTCSSALFLNTMLGNVIQISGQGFYCIQGFTSTTIVTVDRNLGTFSTTSGWVGGALASPGQAAAICTTTNKIWVKTGTYTLTTSSANVAGGVISNPSAGGNVAIEGYGVTRADRVSPPTISVGALTTITVFSNTSGALALVNLIVDGLSATSVKGFFFNSSTGSGYLLTAKNCTNNGFHSGQTTASLLMCSATGCSVQPAFNQCSGTLLEAYANSVTGFSLASRCSLTLCLSYGNTGASSVGFAAGFSCVGYGCVAYGNGSHGFSGSTCNFWINCHSEGNTGAGYSGGAFGSLMVNCSAYNNTGGSSSGFTLIPSLLALSSSAFVNAASSNFALNNTAGGGASLRAAGIPGIYPRGLTTGYQDIGAAQHADPVKLLTVAGMTGGME